MGHQHDRGSPFWVANNGTGTSTLYAGDHVSANPVNQEPTGCHHPWWIADGHRGEYGAATDFIVSSGAASGRAAFLFASQVGIVSGWNTNVPAPGSKQAQIGGTGDAVYTGLAIGQVGTATYLYAADFEHGKIDVYDNTFHTPARRSMDHSAIRTFRTAIPPSTSRTSAASCT